MEPVRRPTPPVDPADLAGLARLLADDTRAVFCLALLDGRAWTAGELARHAGVAPSTTSTHLDRLIAGGLLVEHRQGRHRYVRLAGAHVAQALEDFTAPLASTYSPPPSLRAATVTAALARGRTCYDHLAGRLGVEITDAMTRAGLLTQRTGFAVTEAGLDWLADTVGFDPGALGRSRRPLARACLDWTERRPHLAGVAGAHIRQHLLDQRWIARIGSSRAVRVTPAGAEALRRLLGIAPEAIS